MSAITTKTGLILDWGRTRPEVELRRRRWRRQAEIRSSRCPDSVDCITVTWSPPECAIGRKRPLWSDLRRSPGRTASTIPFSSNKLLPMAHRTPRRFELTGRPTRNSRDPEDLKQGALGSGEAQLTNWVATTGRDAGGSILSLARSL